MTETAPNLDSIVAKAGTRLKWSALLGGLCWCLAVCLGCWLLLFIFDMLLGLPAGLRLPLALGGAVFSGIHLFRKVLRLALQRQTPERTAVMLENRYGIRENLLINAVQFQQQKLGPEEMAFAQQTIAASIQVARRVRFSELWDRSRLWLWGSAAGVVVLLWIVMIVLFPRQLSSAGARFLLPLGDVPPPGDLALKLIPGNDVVVAEGDSLEVGLEVGLANNQSLKKAPLLVWQEKTDFVQPLPSAGENASMREISASNLKPQAGSDQSASSTRRFAYVFANLHTPFSFRAFAGDSYTRSVHVVVQPIPRLRNSLFHVTPPAYTGLKLETSPGPPAAVSVLSGSTVEIGFASDPPLQSADGNFAGHSVLFKLSSGQWLGEALVTNAGSYEIRTAFGPEAKPVVLARGDVQLLPDNPPEVDFVTEDRNRVVQFGQTLALEVQARDDFGLAEIAITARPAEKTGAGRVLKRWSYLGPPGNPGPLRESYSLTIDPRDFEAGASYYLEATAVDFLPGRVPSRSRPIVLRIKSDQDMSLRDEDPLAAAFDALKQAVASQEKANRITGNLNTYLTDVLAKRTLGPQSQALATEQGVAQYHGKEALDLFARKPEGAAYTQPLSKVLTNDMANVLVILRSLESARKDSLPSTLEGVETRQVAILNQLLALLGRIADVRTEKLQPVAEGKDTPQPPGLAQEERAKELLDNLHDFVADEERILEKSRTLADKGPEDLTHDEQQNLGELAREEEKWAKFFDEKLTDFSKLPIQDFADASQAQEFNQVFMEIQKAADALDQKKTELAVPHEQSGLENAQQLVNNLERWLPDKPDNTKWSMEEPLAPADIAMAELPTELEDIVGDLLDKEEDMTPDVQDVTSSWMDSLDKGAGWGASDGPISDMSAKGVTGNLLPNQNEVGGRSGEGRNGRSHGQMVSDTAEGKGGQETPTRLTPEPFEQGSVKDTAKQDLGGATGGGKLSGFTGEGLRGPTAPPNNEKMPRLADLQAKLRQQAEALALKLRRYHVPSGDLETSINAMNQLEQAARKNDGLGVRRSFSSALDSLGEAKNDLGQQIAVQREQNKLPPWMRDEIRVGVQDGIPAGYEEMVGEYFRALAEGRTK